MDGPFGPFKVHPVGPNSVWFARLMCQSTLHVGLLEQGSYVFDTYPHCHLASLLDGPQIEGLLNLEAPGFCRTRTSTCSL